MDIYNIVGIYGQENKNTLSNTIQVCTYEARRMYFAVYPLGARDKAMIPARMQTNKTEKLTE
jgi:hypothetical protein